MVVGYRLDFWHVSKDMPLLYAKRPLTENLDRAEAIVRDAKKTRKGKYNIREPYVL
jgi:hypothetical protein